ncbi:hypothetical protein GCM10023093_00670 [Nemorincola caseinilytica]|uniref:Phosphatidic acid phosphatase type 2/haloperoxidase domain-containing protein n=1 Tax=Nemorincola caseinilytica TaxID=2054315 RepID=A0ABP8N2Y5_9BACT
MLKRNNISLNPYFYLPLIVWMVAGGTLYQMYGKEFMFRAINGHYTDLMDTIMYYTTWMGEAYVIIPALLLLMLIPRLRRWEYFAVAAVVNIVPMLVQQGMKSYFQHPRPLNLYSTAPWLHRLPHWPELYARSFPSGHSEGAFSFFCFITMLLLPRYRPLGLLFFALALGVCYSRVYLAAHFFEDVYAGSIIGAVVSTLCCILMGPLFKRLINDERSTAPSHNGR